MPDNRLSNVDPVVRQVVEDELDDLRDEVKETLSVVSRDIKRLTAAFENKVAGLPPLEGHTPRNAKDAVSKTLPPGISVLFQDFRKELLDAVASIYKNIDERLHAIEERVSKYGANVQALDNQYRDLLNKLPKSRRDILEMLERERESN